MQNIYIGNGWESRLAYLEFLSYHFQLNLEIVTSIAEKLGDSEDFSGLLTALENTKD